MAIKFNSSRAQESLKVAATVAMDVLKDRLYDNAQREMNMQVSGASKHDIASFADTLSNSVAGSKGRVVINTGDDKVDFKASIYLDSESEQEMWDVMTGGNLRTLGNGHDHSHSRPGQEVWGNGMTGRHTSTATVEREYPQLDFEGVKGIEENLVKNSFKTAFGDGNTVAKNVISNIMSNVLGDLQISIS